MNQITTTTLVRSLQVIFGALAISLVSLALSQSFAAEANAQVATSTGNLLVNKVVVGGTATSSDFQIHVKLNGNEIAGSPQAGSVTGTLYSDLATTTYAVSETSAVPNYNASFSGNCDSNGNVLIVASTTRTCTITNTYVAPVPTTGDLKVTKVVVGGNATSSDFQIHVKLNGNEIAGSPQAGTAAGRTYSNLATSTYVVSETGAPANYNASFGGDCDSNGNITVVASTTKNCVITNTYVAPQATTTGALIVTKVATGGDSTFNFQGDGTIGSFAITTSGGSSTKSIMNLAAGTYHVSEVNIPGGWSLINNTCATITIASSATTTCTVTNTKNATTTQGNGEIRGVKFEDWDADGSPFEKRWEEKLGGWTIYLDQNNNGSLDNGEVSTVTKKNGTYRFQNLAPGTYHVREVMQSGWMQITPASGVIDVVVTANKVSKNVDFGNFKLGTISGMKYYDKNGNRRKDNGEEGLPNWTITLTKPDGSTISTTTDANGKYTFVNLIHGKYNVKEVQQSGWVQTTNDPKPISINSYSEIRNVNFGNKHPEDPVTNNGKKEKGKQKEKDKEKNKGKKFRNNGRDD